MASTTYHWQRFWCKREDPIPLDEQGYLSDPEGPFAEPGNSDIKLLDAIAAFPCLILLGEPGAGKSTELQSHFANIQEQARSTGDKALWFDLRQFQTDDRLQRTIFEHPDVLTWRQGTHRLFLFLDSLDECRLHIKTIAALLAHELTQLPAQRLILRIACRSAEWLPGLEADLVRHWGEKQIGFYDLAPLRPSDVQIAAAAYGFPVDLFLAEIERVGVVPLASKPITLNFVLKTFRRDRRLPARQAQLYHDGCRILCDEYNQGRLDAALLGTLSADQRLQIAERIAYLTIFANRATVWTGIDDDDVPVHAIYARTREISARSPLVLPCFGIHPWKAHHYAHDLDALQPLIDASPLLGEIGLDYVWDEDPAHYPAQRVVFAHFLQAAAAHDKIVNLHTKGAEHDVVTMLDRLGVRRAIVHWYSGPRDAFDALIARECYFTFGVETLHSTSIQMLAQAAPLERMLTETDGPEGLHWLTGEIGMPRHIHDVLQAIADTRGLCAADMTSIVAANWQRLTAGDGRLERWARW